MSRTDKGNSSKGRQNGRSRPGRIPWWVIAIPLLAALVVLIYQAVTPYRLSRYQTHLPFTVTDNSVNPPHALELMVIYPDTLALEEIPKMGRPIQIWLTDPQASDPPRTYTIIFEPLADGLLFTDKNGTPVTPGAQLNATKVPLETNVWFLHRTPGTVVQPAAVTLTPRVFAPDGTELELKSASTSGANTISIQLETEDRALLRHFADGVFGPATPLLTLAFTLSGWFLSQRQRELEEKKKREEEEQRRRGQEEQRQREQQTRRRLSEIAGLGTLWDTDHTAAIRRYLEIQKEVSEEPGSEAQGAIHRMWEEGWRTRVEKEAIASLAQGKYDWTHKLTEVLCGDRAADKSTACAILTTLSGPVPPSDEKIRALIGLAAHRGEFLPEALVPTLVESFVHTLSKPAALPKALKEIQERPDARWLIGAPAVQKLCQDRIIAKKPDSEKSDSEKPDSDAAQSLRNLAFARVEWPPLWPLPQGAPAPDRNITEAPQRSGWQENPFGPERIEDDPRARGEATALFSGPWVKPLPWHDLAAAGPTVLLSKRAGYGQTTALALLLQKYAEPWGELADPLSPMKQLYFPVLLAGEMLLSSRMRAEYLNTIAFGVGRALLHFLALNPALFEQSAPSAQQAIARLGLACQDRLGDLGRYLRRYLAEHSKGSSLTWLWLPELLRDVAAGARPVALNIPAEALLTLEEARPAGSQGFVVAVDIPAQLPEGAEAALVTERLRPLIGLAPELALCGVDLKIGLPAVVAPPDLGEMKRIHMAAWRDDDLKRLLDARLAHAQAGLDALMGLGEEISPADWLIESAQGSPRRLIRLGNGLLARFGSKGPDGQLTSEDLRAVCQQVKKEPAAVA